MKTIVHVIDTLGRGGAETLLTDLLPALRHHYNIILVTLYDVNEFGEQVYQHTTAHYCLYHTGWAHLHQTVSRLKKIIKDHQPAVVRAQLFKSSIIARLACPASIPLVFSVHITMNVFEETRKGFALAMVERLTLRQHNILLGVTQQVVDGYKKKFNFLGRSYVLYNYIKSAYFTHEKTSYLPRPQRFIAVGNLRAQKNYQYLIDSFKQMKGDGVEVDIYGDGPLQKQLEVQICQHSLPIYLKGKAANIYERMSDYDGFIMVSNLEGFGIAVAEAMAVGLPLILSDIPVLREVTEGNAFFVDQTKPHQLIELLEAFQHGQKDINRYVEENKRLAKSNYTREVYLEKLLSIYQSTQKQITE